MSTTTIILCGVGGQGTILAADLLAHAAIKAGLDVKVSEIHGMAQRGGSVTTIVRMGDHVESMVADIGCADCVVAFETTEALRNLPFLVEGGSLIVNDEAIKPLSVLAGNASMPQNPHTRLLEAGALLVPASELARQAGIAKASNVVILGALSTQLDIPQDVWEEAIEQRVPPKTVDANLSAFHGGQRYVMEGEAR